MSDVQSATDNNLEDSSYISFTVGCEVFGVPLLGVREIVEPVEITSISNTSDFFLGMINIRGEIVGVIDLRRRFKHPTIDLPTKAMLVFESVAGPIAAVVDKVNSVVKIPDESIDKKPNISSDVHLDFLLGIANVEDKLVTLIDLNKVLGVEMLHSFRKIKMKND